MSGRLQSLRRELPDERRLIWAEGRLDAEQAPPPSPDRPPVLSDDALHDAPAENEIHLAADSQPVVGLLLLLATHQRPDPLPRRLTRQKVHMCIHDGVK